MSELAQALSSAKYDVDAFLIFLDNHPDERWELIDGHPIMMAGGTLDHNTITLNLARLLYPHARKSGCRVQTSDVLVRNPKDQDFAALPDVLVHCGSRDGQQRLLGDPAIIIEVLSRSTVIFDRGRKFAQYRAMPSVQQIVFIYQDQVRVENWTRTEATETASDEPWVMQTLSTLDSRVTFSRLDAETSLSDIYEDARPESGAA
jgi:Uma2 family endonuclease